MEVGTGPCVPLFALPEEIPEHLAAHIARVQSGEANPLIDLTVFNGVDDAINAVDY